MVEIWKEIRTFPGYEVSNYGNVRSVSRYVEHRLSQQYVAGQIRKLQRDRDGYLAVCLRMNKKLKLCRVHRLVADAFVPNPNNHPMVNHLNSKRDDNRFENLEWTDNSGNQKHAFKIGNRSTFGEKHTHNKLRETDVWNILCRVLNGESQRSVSLDYGLSPGMLKPSPP